MIVDIIEMSETQSSRDFLRFIRTKKSVFADTHLMILNEKKEFDFYNLLKKFRQFIRQQQYSFNSKMFTHSVFANQTIISIDQDDEKEKNNQQQQQQKSTFKNQKLLSICKCKKIH